LLKTREHDLYSRDRRLGALWDLSVNRIRADNPAAVQLLDICAFLGPEPIPLDLLTIHPDQMPGPLATVVRDELDFNDTVAAVVGYSLAKRDTVGLQMHRSVQAALRAKHPPLPPSRDRESDALGGRSLVRQSRQRGHPLAVALRLLSAYAPPQITGAPEGWPRWRILLPHVLAIAERAAGVDGADAAGGEAWSSLLGRAGLYLQAHGRAGEGLPLVKRGLAISEAVYGPNHPKVALQLANLAWVLRDLGLAGEARPLLERELAINEAALGPDDFQIAGGLSSLVWVLRDLGLPGEARPLAERALAITEAAHGPDPREVAADLCHLAAVLRDLGLPGEARPLAQRAARMRANGLPAGPFAGGDG